MKMRNILLVGIASIALSCSAIASSIKDEVLNAAFVEHAKVVQLQAHPALTVQYTEVLTALVHRDNQVLIHDYGGEVNSVRLTCERQEIAELPANFAKVQNLNFERMS